MHELQQFQIKIIEAKAEELREARLIALGNSVLLFRLALPKEDVDSTEGVDQERKYTAILQRVLVS